MNLEAESAADMARATNRSMTMKLIDSPDDVRATILAEIEQARVLEGIYQRQVDDAQKAMEPYRRERWALERVLAKLDADPAQPANDAEIAVAAE